MIITTLVLLAVVLLIAPEIADADTISTSSVPFSMSSTETPVPSQSEILNFAQFNPPLGTLKSVPVADTSKHDMSAIKLRVTLSKAVGRRRREEVCE